MATEKKELPVLAPFLTPTSYPLLTPREGDIYVCTPPKMGTTWCLNICAQLMHHGRLPFENIGDACPWIEFNHYKGQPPEERIKFADALPSPRLFKAHFSPGELLPLRPGSKYIVCVRNVQDATVSLVHFARVHNPDFLDYWGLRDTFLQLNLDTAIDYQELIAFAFLREALSLAPLHPDALLLVHFANLKRDLPAEIRRIARFLGAEPSPEELERILSQCGFHWMKEHEHLFDPIQFTCPPPPSAPPSAPPIPILPLGKMIRHGDVGYDLSPFQPTPRFFQRLHELEQEYFPDPTIRSWVENGGPIPPSLLPKE